MGGISGKAFALVVVFVLVMLAFFLFPGIMDMVSGNDTTGFGDILNVEHSFIPYVVIIAAILGVLGLLRFFKR